MTVELLLRKNCHLCEEAAAVLDELNVRFERVDIDAQPAMAALYADAVPVVLIDGHEIARAPVERTRLRAALAGATTSNKS